MLQKSLSGRSLNNSITCDDILGKEVIDKDGGFIGVVEKVLIDPGALEFIGISVDKGFLRRGLSIGKNYIDKVAEHAIFLKIPVAYEIKGKIVFDKDGKEVGIVSGIDLYGEYNRIKNLIVKPYSLFPLVKEIEIPYSYVREVGDNVMLNVAKSVLKSEK